MEIVLVRHGSRFATPDAPDAALTEHGRHQVELLGRALRHRMCEIDSYFTSYSEHAQETARLLQAELGAAGTPLHLLKCLTPDRGPGDVDTLLDQATCRDADLENRHGLLLVGHEGQLSDLVTELTGQRARPLGHGEAICVRGASLAELAAGQGKVRFRYPTFDHQEEPLRSKVQSKMTVSTFLAGFVFTALSAVLVLDTKEWTIAQAVAVVALTFSLALFIACVYIFDQLSMPAGFWTDAERPRAWRWFYERAEHRREEQWHATADDAGMDAADEEQASSSRDGPRYHLMISTSRLLFTPAAWCALAGFVALLVATGDPRMIIGGCVGLAVAGGYALTRRPDLGAD